MLIKNQLKAGDTIEYIGDNWIAFSGQYKLYTTESTYINKEDCPIDLRDNLIIHVESGDRYLFYPLTLLRENEWIKV